MKPLASPADKKKAIGLVIGCVLVFGFLVKNMMSINSGTPPPPQTVAIGGATGDAPVAAIPPPEGGATTVSLGGPAPADAGPDKNLLDPPKFPPSETPNPFHKANGDSFVDPNAGIPQPIRPVGRRNNRKSGRNSDQESMSGIILPDPNGPNSAVVVRPDPEPMQVLGVATGPKSVAVIQVGSKQFVVDRGEKFGKGLRLKEVSNTQVVIEQNGELHILRVGVHPPSSTAPSTNSQTPPVITTPLPGAGRSAGIS